MAKSNKDQITPEQALEFLDNFQKMLAGQDSQAKPISIRIPENILDAFKIMAKNEGRPYQSMMIEALRNYLSSYNRTT